MMPTQLSQNLLALQMEQTTNGSEVREAIRDNRSQEIRLEIDVLNGNRQAAGLRSEANNIRATFNGLASAVGAVGTCCAAIPYAGPIIAAICAAIAAVLVAIGNIWGQAKEDEAANLERETGKTNLAAEQVGNLVDDLKEDNKAREEFVDQLRERLTDVIKEGRQVQRW